MKKPLLVAGVCLALHAHPACAWWPQGHSILAAAALKALPDDVPAYFRNDPGLVAHCAQDPDVAKSAVLPYMTAREEPEHFIDYEMLKGQPLPPTRAAFVAWALKNNVDPNKVGYVPYAIAEWTERLTMAFAEQRKYPNNPYIQTKSLLYAGFLAHYAGDICMPLHTTVDYDGRVTAAGRSPHSGIHAKVDSLIEKLPLRPEDLAAGQKVEPLAEVATDARDNRAPLIPGIFPAILKELDGSHALIGKTYQLEAQLPPDQGDWKPSADVTAFTTERGREATRFIASLYLTAWRKSADIRLPRWLEREAGK